MLSSSLKEAETLLELYARRGRLRGYITREDILSTLPRASSWGERVGGTRTTTPVESVVARLLRAEQADEALEEICRKIETALHMLSFEDAQILRWLYLDSPRWSVRKLAETFGLKKSRGYELRQRALKNFAENLGKISDSVLTGKVDKL